MTIFDKTLNLNILFSQQTIQASLLSHLDASNQMQLAGTCRQMRDGVLTYWKRPPGSILEQRWSELAYKHFSVVFLLADYVSSDVNFKGLIQDYIGETDAVPVLPSAPRWYYKSKCFSLKSIGVFYQFLVRSRLRLTEGGNHIMFAQNDGVFISAAPVAVFFYADENEFISAKSIIDDLQSKKVKFNGAKNEQYLVRFVLVYNGEGKNETHAEDRIDKLTYNTSLSLLPSRLREIADEMYSELSDYKTYKEKPSPSSWSKCSVM